jgi:hypothetical protein
LIVIENALLWNFTSAGPAFDLIATNALLNLKQGNRNSVLECVPKMKGTGNKIPHSGCTGEIN